MLELKNISKTYRAGGVETIALDDISVSFREKEFVAILGTSGSGKTTCLNIIGGLGHADRGEVIIKGRKTKDFKESDWDAYRNNAIGFVFQNYNLIPHLSIIENVELGMTLGGVPAEERKRRALKLLEQVGLKGHLHKKPEQLSGGEMQRVAIARALANDPEILLCDEPTGALDTKTSGQIMDLIREVAGNRLVVMVTHNMAVAEKYADRLIGFQDGKIISDSNPYQEALVPDSFGLKKTNMNFPIALKLSYNNIKSKKGRAFLTAFASSIGIIGIAVILSLSSGFQKQIDTFQSDAMTEYPIIISQAPMSVERNRFTAMRGGLRGRMLQEPEPVVSDEVFLIDPSADQTMHTNVITEEFLGYLNGIDPDICRSVSLTRTTALNLVRETEDSVVPVTLRGSEIPPAGGSSSAMAGRGMSGFANPAGVSSLTSLGLSSFPRDLREEETPYVQRNYDLLAGEYPGEATDLVLVVDEENQLDGDVLRNLGFETSGAAALSFESIVGTRFILVHNDDYYVKTAMGTYLPGSDYQAMADSEKSVTLRIAGIVRQKEGVKVSLLASGIAYADELMDWVIDAATASDIVKAQAGSEKNVMNLSAMTDTAKATFLSYLGGNAIPSSIMLYPETFEDKEEVAAYLEAYNAGREEEDQILHTDLAETISQMTGGIINGITIVLVAFAAISLIVSLIMISIITYTSVLERTKEIGVLRSLGARKKDITRVFDAETFILGLLSGLMGVAVAWLLTIPMNRILVRLTELENIASLQLSHVVILITVSTLLAVLGGHVPAKMASEKDAVEALRSE
ncbi:MAG: ABC transporter ATP-binding protein/permease [Eubacteriales bacterium]|nr:ABC transporter ATP-binding protein/permease [Eubacteriales bacterium]